MRRILAAAAIALCAAACDGSKEKAAPGLSPADAVKLIALENRGIGALERFDYTDAVAPLREASQLAPAWIAGRFNLALALMHAGREHPEEARTILDGIL